MAPCRGQGEQNCTTRSVAVVRTHCSGTPERSIERIPVTFLSVLLLLLLFVVAAVVFVCFMSSFLIFYRR